MDHPNFPWGKGIWIHDIPNCLGGNIESIIKKLKDNDISNVLIKTGDGDHCYPNNVTPQLTAEITDRFHAAGIKVYSWSYVYGQNPNREAAIAMWSLEQLHVDGHVFDAESEYEHLANNAAAAELMLKAVREKHPDAFLAHAPFPYIKYHEAFPYVTFGKYCNAVMPQDYWGTIGIPVSRMMADMYADWSAHEAKWKAEGHGDSVKPLIPAGQGYDNPQTNYVLTPEQLTDFITQSQGYGAVNFWVFEYLVRDDLWAALRDTKIGQKKVDTSAQTTSQNTTPAQTSATHAEAPTTPSNPTSEVNGSTTSATEVNGSTVTPVNTTPSPEVTQSPAAIPSASTDTDSQEQIVTIPAVIPVPETGKTKITVEKDSSSPTGTRIKVTTHKPHIDYILEFFRYVVDVLIPKIKGGEKK